MLKNVAWLAVLIYLFSFLVFLIMLAPATLVVYGLPPSPVDKIQHSKKCALKRLWADAWYRYARTYNAQ